jgi:hypothetical protein
MNCAEFQNVLPYIIESGGNAEEEAHLSACPVCSDLVEDLRYIAEQAKLLLPMRDPNPEVWDNIQGSLEREGLVKPARARGRLLGPTGGNASRWTAAAVLLLFVLGVAWYQRSKKNSEPASEDSGHSTGQISQASLSSPFSDQDDQQLLIALEESRPGLRNTYATNLKQVNAYIHDAEQNLQQNPDDVEARQHVMDAYDQKTMMYEMATRSMQ